jgi:hypothetical protein
MSLSDEERLTGMYWAVKRMHTIAYGERFASGFKDTKDYARLISLVGDLWHGLLGREANTTHWLLGSSATGVVTRETSGVWGEAIRGVYRDAVEEEDEVIRRVANEFDPFKEYLSIGGLIEDHDMRKVYDLFAWSEQLAYYLRRYEDDNLVGEYAALSKTLSDIQGECFQIFTDEETFAKAYFLHRTLIHIYGDFYVPEKRDVVTKWLCEDNMHHDLSRPVSVYGEDLKWVIDLHHEIAEARAEGKLTKQMRLMAALKIAGRRFHYTYKHEELRRRLVGDSDFDLLAIGERLAKCVEEYEADKKERAETHDSRKAKEYDLR